jgi:hypothetical protein
MVEQFVELSRALCVGRQIVTAGVSGGRAS